MTADIRARVTDVLPGIRRDLEALIDRKTFYRLAAAATEDAGRAGIRSGGVFFPLEP